MNGRILRRSNPRNAASATVTAGLRWAPLIRPATKTAIVTPRPQPKAIELWSPDARDFGNPPVTTWATTPQPNRTRIAVPSNSPDNSPMSGWVFFMSASSVCCRCARDWWRRLVTCCEPTKGM